MYLSGGSAGETTSLPFPASKGCPSGHEFGLTPGVGDGQGGLACCDSWGRKETDMTE